MYPWQYNHASFISYCVMDSCHTQPSSYMYKPSFSKTGRPRGAFTHVTRRVRKQMWFHFRLSSKVGGPKGGLMNARVRSILQIPSSSCQNMTFYIFRSSHSVKSFWAQYVLSCLIVILKSFVIARKNLLYITFPKTVSSRFSIIEKQMAFLSRMEG